MSKFKSGIAAALAYLQANPGVVSFIVAQGLLLLAHFGLHLTEAELYQAAAVAIPLVLAYFKGAEHANKMAIRAKVLEDVKHAEAPAEEAPQA